MKPKINVENFNALRYKAGFTLESLARETGISLGAIRSYAAKTYTPGPAYAKKIATALKCNVEDFIDLE